MATGGTDATVVGLGEGGMQWIPPFQLKNSAGSEMFGVDVSGNVTFAGTSTIVSASDVTVTNTAPSLSLRDSTASAKDLIIKVDADKANMYEESAGAAGDILTLDLANKRVGVATASPTVALDVTGAAKISTTLTVTGASTLTGDVTASGALAVTGASTLTGNVTAAGTLGVTGVFTPSGGVARTAQKRLYQVGAKVGATSGWLVNAADNKNSLGRLPASQTGSTLVIPLDGLKVGDSITAYHLVGQIESAGGICTVDASLRKQTAAAADLSDGEVAAGGMTQLSVTADTIMSSTNTAKSVTSDTVGADETFYLLLTATTAASTDIDLQAIALTVTEA